MMTKLTLYIFLFCSFFVVKAQQSHTLVIQKGASLKLQEGTLLYIQGDLVADTLGKGITKITVENNANLVLGDAKDKKSNWYNLQETSLYVDGKGTVWLAASYGQSIEGNNSKEFSTSFNNVTLSDNFPKDSNKNTQKQINGTKNTVEIRGTLDLNDEYLKTNHNDLWVTNPDTNAIKLKGAMNLPLPGAERQGMITSDSAGCLIRATNSKGNYYFPTGQLNNDKVKGFYPVTLTPRGNTFNFYSVRTVVENPASMIGIRMDPSIDTLNKTFFQKINHLAGSEEADIKLHYDEKFDLNRSAETTNTLVQYDDKTGWTNIGTPKNGKMATSSKYGQNSNPNNPYRLSNKEGVAAENITIAKVNNRFARAAFESNTKKGCLPLSIQFVNKSVHSQKVWWTFEGGFPDTSTAWNPTVVYNKAGKFAVKMYVKNAISEDTLVKTEFVEVLGPPNASFTYNLPLKAEVEVKNTSTNFDYVSWVINGKVVAGKTNPFRFDIDKTGTQKIKMIAHNQCGSSEYVKEFYQNIQVDCAELNMNFEPNPAVSYTYLKLNGETTVDLPYQLFTIEGRLVSSGIITTNTKNVEFDVRNLLSATYIIAVDCKTTRQVQKLLVTSP
jgi:PKD repeat protein